MSLTLTLDGNESAVARRAMLNALVAYAAAFGEIGIDAPDIGRAPAASATPFPPLAAPPISAPSGAGAAALPTAQEAFAGTSLPPPPAGTLPAPPAAPTVSAPAAAPTVSAPSGELDSAGQPWDPALHASSKTKIADGTWRKRRGSKEDGTEAASLPAPPAATGASLPPPATGASLPPPPAVVHAPASPTAAAPAAGGAPADFPAFMAATMALITTGKISGSRVKEICQMCGAEGLPQVGEKPVLIPSIWEFIGAETAKAG